MIGVIDYGAGNLGSVMNALARLGCQARFVRDAEELYGKTRHFEKLIFPGDGHFATAMSSLSSLGYDSAIRDWIAQDRPFLGICIGLQLLFESSEEAPPENGQPVKGLSILPGKVKLLPCRKVPQIGWNKTSAHSNSRLFSCFGEEEFLYYIHSYYAAPAQPEDCAATANYAIDFCAAVERGALAAVQFHPEKSGGAGLRLLKNWLDLL
ncbi:MAG: imidazole glycerol phosphate synthase subunit HisH [Spirochaetaceae bacterium]|jgi:imidazole glycerol phosphate synthase glutamine amidotransferase subunit|nr:imidazole glycerol phosphate synthase subunit HisH [Spirochaetaceae bacterium]